MRLTNQPSRRVDQSEVTNADHDLAKATGINARLIAQYRTGARSAAPWLRRLIAEHTEGPRS